MKRRSEYKRDGKKHTLVLSRQGSIECLLYKKQCIKHMAEYYIVRIRKTVIIYHCNSKVSKLNKG